MTKKREPRPDADAQWEENMFKIMTARRPRGVPIRSTRVGRNARCPCGSNMKFKHCHGTSVR